MKENDPSYSWNDKIRLTYPHDRCMNKISPFPCLINYIVGCMILYILSFPCLILYIVGCMILYILWRGGSEVGKPSDEPKRRQYRMSTPSRTPPLKEANSQIKSTNKTARSRCRVRRASLGDGALAKQLEPLAIPGRYPQRMIGAQGARLLTFENSVVYYRCSRKGESSNN